MGRHAKADFEAIYDHEWAKIDQSERPQAEHMLTYFLKTKTAALLAYFERDDVSPLTKTVRILYWKMTSRSPARSKKAPADASAGVVAPPGLRKQTLHRRTWYGRYAAVLPQAFPLGRPFASARRRLSTRRASARRAASSFSERERERERARSVYILCTFK